MYSWLCVARTSIRRSCARTVAVLLLALGASLSLSASTIDPAYPYAYGANVGWINARGDGGQGAAIGRSFCTGFLWSANCGWIGLGNGPTNGVQYSNASAEDWGVNHDGTGRLTGYAYGANIGWITFEQTYGQPRVDLGSGNMSGSIYGANVGWISLAHSEGCVRTERLEDGPDSDGDSIPDAWELAHTNRLTALDGSQSDADNDGSPDIEEYRADTDPLDGADRLRLVGLRVAGQTNTVRWTSRPTRLYRIEAAGAVTGAWGDAAGGLLSPSADNVATASVNNVIQPVRFYRVRAVVPLSQ